HELVGLGVDRPHVGAIDHPRAGGGLEDATELLPEGERLLQRGGKPIELLHVGRQALEFTALLFALAKQARVLNGQCRLGGDGREQPYDLRRELAGHLPDHGQAADQVIFPKEWNREEPPVAGAQQYVADWALEGRRADVRQLNRLRYLRQASR